MRSSSSRSFIWPWATSTRTSGTSSLEQLGDRADACCTRLCTKKTCPPRRTSRRIASRISASSKRQTWVRIASRSAGGVSMTERSRRPVKAICSVRGIGVAVSVSTSTVFFSCLMRSLCATPKRCSSSTTSSPRSRKLDVLLEQAVRADHDVDRARSRGPRAPRGSPWACGSATATRCGPGSPRSAGAKVSACCWHSTVVGTSTATCLPSITALKAARTATSVLP